MPAANLLGEIGKGHKIAFNTLNYGRLKLGAMCSGGARIAIEEAARYATERKQFGRSIASFGAIRQKLGEMIARQYAVEAMLYRTTGAIDAMLAGRHDPQRILETLEEFAIESSILKVAASEAVDFILDENVQIHGGNGFVRDYPAERRYRDARVNRIFEGTNEINRLLIPGLLLRRGVAGSAADADAFASPQDRDLGGARAASVAGIKRAALTVLATAAARFGGTLNDEQEVLLAAADMVIEAFASESAILRARQSGDPLHAAAAQLYVSGAAARADHAAATALPGILQGDALDRQAAAVRSMVARPPINTIALGRELADAAVLRRTYPF
ncbi:MAG: acyl-CoA dehydrogenase family protein [Vicinamibacterales bacterium]